MMTYKLANKSGYKILHIRHYIIQYSWQYIRMNILYQYQIYSCQYFGKYYLYIHQSMKWNMN